MSEPHDESTQRIFDSVTAAGMTVPSLYRALANAPRLLKGWTQFAWSLRFGASTPRELREFTILRVAFKSGSQYEWRHHEAMAREIGIAPAVIDVARDSGGMGILSPQEQACMRLADDMIELPKVSDTTSALCRAQFTDAEYVELVVTVAFYVCVAKVVSALELD